MSVIINIDYINQLSHLPSDSLPTISAEGFFTALSACYGRDAVTNAVTALAVMPDSAYKGVRAFKDRLLQAIDSKGSIAGSDQVYIANLTQRTALGDRRR